MKIIILILLFLSSIFNVVICQQLPNNFFLGDSVLQVTITAPMNKILNNGGQGKDINYPAIFTCLLPDSTTVTQDIKLEVRGHFRRSYCFIPPLRVNFNPNDSSILPLSSLKKLKLVNSCLTNKIYNQYLLMEFLIYKIYNLLTEKSFRVKLLEVTYLDKDNKKKPVKIYAFLMESLKELAKRNNCREDKIQGIKSEKTDRKQMTMVALFEYMIGNTDWSVTVKHNIETIRSIDDSTGRPYAIPYDFDYSGLINTPYAIPNEDLPIQKVQERLYRGYTRTIDELNEALDVFKTNKEKIYDLINHFELLSKEYKKGMILYLDQFYDLIKDQRDIKNAFIYNARSD